MQNEHEFVELVLTLRIPVDMKAGSLGELRAIARGFLDEMVKAEGKGIECTPGIALPHIWSGSYQWHGDKYEDVLFPYDPPIPDDVSIPFGATA
jgi:hypothetical protein